MKTEREIVEAVEKWRDDGAASHHRFCRQAKDAQRFYDGDQWDEADRRQLREEGRPCLTINLVRPQIDLICGIQRQEKIDIKFIGRTADDAPIADAMTKLVKFVCDRNDFEMRQGDVFADGVLTGRGWFIVEQSFRDDWIHGEILVRREPPDEVIIPQGVDRDLSDCPWVLRIKQVPIAVAERLWPKAKLKLTDPVDGSPSDEGTDYGRASSATPMGTYEATTRPPDTAEVIEAYWEEWVPVAVVTDTATGSVQVTEDMEAAKEAKRLVPTVDVIRRTRRRIRCARLSGSTLLEGPVDVPGDRYPLVPFFCFRSPLAGDYGIVKNLLDPQREVNKRRSQALHIINTSANSGWISDDPELLEQLAQFGNRPGMTALKKPQSSYERIMPSVIPASVVQMESLGRDDLKAISGINSDLLGFREATQSGVAIDLRMRQGMTIVAQIFDQFRLALKEVARRVAARVIAYMPEEEIARVLGEEGSPEIMAAVKRADVLRYDLVAAQSPSSPSVRMANFLMLMEMRKAGIPIPDELIVEASDLPGKEKILEKLAAPKPIPGTTPPGIPPSMPPLGPGGGAGAEFGRESTAPAPAPTF